MLTEFSFLGSSRLLFLSLWILIACWTKLSYSVVHSISGAQQTYRCTRKWFSSTYTSVSSSPILFPFRSLQSTEQSTLCYAQDPCLNSPQYCYMSLSAFESSEPPRGHILGCPVGSSLGQNSSRTSKWWTTHLRNGVNGDDVHTSS